MSTWLILGNRLWDYPKREKFSKIITLYNLSTVLTISLCILALYLFLVMLILVGAGVIITPSFMAETLGHTAAFSNYLDIAWLSAAMGTVAGALGASFDSETNLRTLAHGQRERQRKYAQGYIKNRREEDATQCFDQLDSSD